MPIDKSGNYSASGGSKGFLVPFLTILVVVLLGIAGYLFWERNYKVTDPFQNVNAQSYGSEGKVLEVNSDSIVFEAGVSTSVGQQINVALERRTAKFSENTRYYKYSEDGARIDAIKDEVQVGKTVTVTSKQNPNVNQEITAEEVLIIR